MKAIRPLNINELMQGWAPSGMITYFPEDVSVETLRESVLRCFGGGKGDVVLDHYHISGIDDGPGGAAALDVAILRRLMMTSCAFGKMC